MKSAPPNAPATFKASASETGAHAGGHRAELDVLDQMELGYLARRVVVFVYEPLALPHPERTLGTPIPAASQPAWILPRSQIVFRVFRPTCSMFDCHVDKDKVLNKFCERTQQFSNSDC